MKRFRVASTKAEEIHSGATFAPGEEAVGFDPSDPDDARKLGEGLFVQVHERSVPTPSKAVIEKAAELGVDLTAVDQGSGKHGAILVSDVERIHHSQEASQ